MRIGLLAYSTNTGLGYQTLDFYNNIKTEKVLIVDLFKFNQVETHHERYNNARITDGIPNVVDCEWLCQGIDLLFVCENPLTNYLYESAKKNHVKIVQQFNPEFLEYYSNPYLVKPDILANPSYWKLEQIESRQIAKTVYLPVPVNNQSIIPRVIDKVETLLHIAGRPASHDRNGTISFIETALKLGKKYKYKLYIQIPKEGKALEHYERIRNHIKQAQLLLGSNFQVISDCENNIDMYSDGDILIMPRRYGGLCLPIWEAMSYGMPIIMPNIDPNNRILPKEWLCEAQIQGEFMTKTNITIYNANNTSLISSIDLVSKNITKCNQIAIDMAQKMSWEYQKDNYMKLFKTVVNI